MTNLEAAALLSHQGYTDTSIEEILTIYNALTAHIPFEDTRRDRRFVVKFHDVSPQDLTQDEFDHLFQYFCDCMYDDVTDGFTADQIRLMFAPYQTGQHYDSFDVYIPAITQDNAFDLATTIYDEGLDSDYVENYITLTTRMMDLEAHYLEYWDEFVATYRQPHHTNKENNNGRIN